MTHRHTEKSQVKTRRQAAFASLTGETPKKLLYLSSRSAVARQGNTVVRVAPFTANHLNPHQACAVARLVNRAGVPTVTNTYTGNATNGEALTVSTYQPTDTNKPFPARQTGKLLAKIHQITAKKAKGVLGEITTLEQVADWGIKQQKSLEKMGVTPPRELSDMLQETCHQMRKETQKYPEDHVFLHGDVNPGNILWGKTKTPILCDFDAAVWGLWIWDFAGIAVNEKLGLMPQGTIETMARAYGKNPRTHPAWLTVCRARAANVTIYYLRELACGTVTQTQVDPWINWCFQQAESPLDGRQW